MCTIVVMHRVARFAPLVVAANRDEFYARASSPAALFGTTRDGARIIAGRDEVAGGTWLGGTSSGFFAAVTNQRSWWPTPKKPRSRGELVAHALTLGNVAAVDSWLEALPVREFAEFNLIYGDADALHVVYGRDAGVQLLEMPPGVHVLTNDRMGSPEMPKEERARRLAEALVELPREPLIEGLQRLLTDTRAPRTQDVPAPPEGSRFERERIARLQAICIRTPVYGTGSATLLAAASDAMRVHLFAAGAPDRTPFVDVTDAYRGPPI